MVRCWRGTLKQPFGIKLFWNIHHAHQRFLNKTVLVVNNDVTAAFHLLNRFIWHSLANILLLLELIIFKSVNCIKYYARCFYVRFT